tara:strand:+ start:294 stop:593 length:300 start_codon:yes stop_codon:yes gene_type:complete
MKFLIDNILVFSLAIVLLIQLVYWIFDKIKTKENIERLREEMRDGIIGVKRHDKNNQQNSLSIVIELLKTQEERIKNVENKIQNIEKNFTHDESNNKTN